MTSQGKFAYHLCMDVPYISHEEPLPGSEKPEGNWYRPYHSNVSPGREEWAVMRRGELTEKQRAFGLKKRLVADTLPELERQMELQDERLVEFETHHQVPAWKHRA